jgi:hypothetical protein
MIEELKKLLEEGSKDAINKQIENNNSNLILTGRHNAFSDVLSIILKLEEEKKNGSDSKPKKQKSKN